MTSTITNPFLGWHRCDECGAEADTPCMGADDRPAVEVCEGRGFGDGVEDEPAPAKKAPLRRRATGPRKPPTYVACTHCHDPIKVTGIASKREHLYCSKRECRRAYDRAWQLEHIGPLVQHRCWWCDAPLSPVGRSRTAKRPCCGAVECAKALKRMWEAENRRKTVTETP